MVTAVVVRIPAAELALANSTCSTTGESNHKLAKGKRVDKGVAKPMRSNINSKKSSLVSKGWFSTSTIACANMPAAV